jgi:hypothetical protein
MGKKFSRCIRQDTVGTADESYVGCDTLQGISVQKHVAPTGNQPRRLRATEHEARLTTAVGFAARNGPLQIGGE